MTRDFRHSIADGKPGTIEQKTGPVSYIVWLDTGLLWRSHVDHIRQYENNTIVPSDDIAFELIPPANDDQNNTRAHQPNTTFQDQTWLCHQATMKYNVATRCYQVRNHRPVDHFMYSNLDCVISVDLVKGSVV